MLLYDTQPRELDKLNNPERVAGIISIYLVVDGFSFLIPTTRRDELIVSWPGCKFHDFLHNFTKSMAEVLTVLSNNGFQDEVARLYELRGLKDH